jgi:pimeloyl-ACP methyl ester carboxylesterase
MGDTIFDAFYASNVQFILNATYQQSTVQSAGAQLLDVISTPVWLLGHNQGVLLALLIADARPRLTYSLILLEPTGPPFQDAIFGSTPARPLDLTDVAINYMPSVTDPVT